MMKHPYWLFLPALLWLGVTQAQTCNSAIPETTPTADFILQNGGAEVLHTATGLIWKRCLETQIYDSATQSCSDGSPLGTHLWSQALGETDGTWRLPNIKELKSIVERSCHSPTINLTIFPNQKTKRVWSSSPYAYGYSSAGPLKKKGAWVVDFNTGRDFYKEDRDRKHYVRLVRDSQ